ncbi:transcriptional regulator FnrL [Actibacterium sp. 188UL27-1]|uniref:transcriptional regulator FnrL n=1 Tax=Actibacterium sp. 188UL27-1 TaxID=2786961 RepID=UPI00195F1623|nr:helix-turn-helix domain-containing protein [Actibacterium sp. 188UL27-1]MBM7068783.1 helix-turn-helix domain-containing protein [Actibacterium sp. 188UL27-1]
MTSTMLAECADCPIRHRAVCALCEPHELTLLEDIKYYRQFAPGDTIVWAGEKLDFVASVVTGMAALNRTMEDGRRQITGLLLPSDFLGRPGRSSVRYDVSAISDVSLCCFRRKPFEDLVESTPHIGQRLLEMSMDELDAAREWMLVLGRKTARERIASLLAMILQRETQAKPADAGSALRIDLPLSREGIADCLGMTLETVSRQLSHLKRDGVIQLEGRRTVLIPDMDQLLLEAADDADGGVLD